MSLFKKKNTTELISSQYPLDKFEPVIRSSVCTGERTACMRNRETGKRYEIMLIRDSEDLAEFGKKCGMDAESIRTVY